MPDVSTSRFRSQSAAKRLHVVRNAVVAGVGGAALHTGVQAVGLALVLGGYLGLGGSR